MNEKAQSMKKEIRNISGYRALILSKYYICILLVISTFYMGIHKFGVSPLYILLFLTFLPSIISYSIHEYAQKYHNKFLKDLLQEAPVHFVNLKKKYKYSKVSYVSNQTAYIFSSLLICLWQINSSYSINPDSFLSKLPLIILGTALTLRFLLALLYRVKLPHDLMHNKI